MIANRNEKGVERVCDQLIATMGGTVIRFSQARATNQTLGIPDRRYRIRETAVWFECKAANGKLTREQYDFLLAELRLGFALCGGLDALMGFLNAPNDARRAEYCHDTLRVWRTRGFRGEPKSKACIP